MGKNYAFIDAQNLHMAIGKLGWKIDYLKFRKYLKEHYKIEKAYMFMGFKPTEQQMYGFLQSAGFILNTSPKRKRLFQTKQEKTSSNRDYRKSLQNYTHKVN